MYSYTRDLRQFRFGRFRQVEIALFDVFYTNFFDELGGFQERHLHWNANRATKELFHRVGYWLEVVSVCRTGYTSPTSVGRMYPLQVLSAHESAPEPS